MNKQTEKITFHVEKTLILRPKAWMSITEADSLIYAQQVATWMRAHIAEQGETSKVRIRKATTVTMFEIVEEEEV
jgi:hypothetical protein